AVPAWGPVPAGGAVPAGGTGPACGTVPAGGAVSAGCAAARVPHVAHTCPGSTWLPHVRQFTGIPLSRQTEVLDRPEHIGPSDGQVDGAMVRSPHRHHIGQARDHPPAAGHLTGGWSRACPMW